MTSLHQDIIKIFRKYSQNFAVEDFLDAVWMSRHLEPLAPDTRTGTEVYDEGYQTPSKKSDEGLEDFIKEKDETIPEEQELEDGSAFTDRTGAVDTGVDFGDVYLPRADGKRVDGKGFRIPAASVLSNMLELSRSLRPFMQRVPSRVHYSIDEEKTAARIADEGIWTPALSLAMERWFNIELVIDAGASMDVWHDAGYELFNLLKWMGAFRNIRVWSLATDEPRPNLYAGFVQSREYPNERNPLELIDANNRNLVLILSDSVSPAWHAGGMTKLLDLWGAHGPVAVIQVFPEHLWPRTALNIAEPVNFYSPFTSAPNSKLILKALEGFPGIDKNRLDLEAPVPVVTFDHISIFNWAKFVTGATTTDIPGFVFRKDAKGHPFEITQFTTDLNSSRSLERFWLAASPTAVQLALLIAASPSISLNVIRIIRDALLPEATHVHEAEILLAGILETVKGFDEDVFKADDIQYQFRGDIRDQLLDNLPARDSLKVLNVVSTYIESHLGNIQNFQAILADPSTGTGSITVSGNPIAKITAEILRRLGGDYARLIRKAVEKSSRTKQTHDGPPDVHPAELVTEWEPEAPVRNLSEFIGREDILKDIKTSGNSHILIWGIPKTGMTSLLYVLGEYLSKDSRCCYIDMKVLLVKGISYEEFESAFSEKCVAQHSLRIKAFKEGTTFQNIRRLVNDVRGSRRLCVFCLDNFVVPTSVFAPEDFEKFNRFIREIFSFPNGRMILTCNQDERQRIEDYLEDVKLSVSIQRKYKILHLPLFIEAEVKKAIRRKYRSNLRQTEDVYRYIGCFPHLIHLYDKWNKEAESIEEYSRTIASDFSEFIFSYFRDLSPDARLLMVTLFHENLISRKIGIKKFAEVFPLLIQPVPKNALIGILKEIARYGDGFDGTYDDYSFSIGKQEAALLFQEASKYLPWSKVLFSLYKFSSNPTPENADAIVSTYSELLNFELVDKSGRDLENQYFQNLMQQYKDEFYIRRVSEKASTTLGMPLTTFIVMSLKPWKKGKSLMAFQSLYLSIREFIRKLRSATMDEYSRIMFYILFFELSGMTFDEIRKDMKGLERISIINALTMKRVLLDREPLFKSSEEIFRQLNRSEHSPYITAGTTQELFFGRELEIALIRGLPENIGVVGPRTIGKTSLLLRLYHAFKCQKGWEVFALDCSSIDSEKSFLENLAEKMGIDFHIISDMEKFRKYITQRAEKEQIQFLFLLDEVDRLVEYDIKNYKRIFITFLRLCYEVLANNEAAARFVFFGFQEMYIQMLNRESLLYNFMVFLPLKSLNREGALALVTVPMQGLHVHWENAKEDAGYLVDQCSGHPLLLQTACNILLTILDNKKDRRDIIERNDVDRTLFSDPFQELCMRFYGPPYSPDDKTKGLFGRRKKSLKIEKEPFIGDIHKITILTIAILYAEESINIFTLTDIREELKKYQIVVSPFGEYEIVTRLCLNGTLRMTEEATLICQERKTKIWGKIPEALKSDERMFGKLKIETPDIYNASPIPLFKYEFAIKIFPKILIAHFDGIENCKRELTDLVAKGNWKDWVKRHS